MLKTMQPSGSSIVFLSSCSCSPDNPNSWGSRICKTPRINPLALKRPAIAATRKSTMSDAYRSCVSEHSLDASLPWALNSYWRLHRCRLLPPDSERRAIRSRPYPNSRARASKRLSFPGSAISTTASNRDSLRSLGSGVGGLRDDGLSLGRVAKASYGSGLVGRDPYPPRDIVYFATATFAKSVTFELELASPSASAANWSASARACSLSAWT